MNRSKRKGSNKKRSSGIGQLVNKAIIGFGCLNGATDENEAMELFSKMPDYVLKKLAKLLIILERGFPEMNYMMSLIFEPQNHGYHDINEDDLPESKGFYISQTDWNNDVATRNIENGKGTCPIISKGPGYSEHDAINWRDSSVGSNMTSYPVGGYIHELDPKVDEKMNVGTDIKNTSVSQTGNLESASGGAQPKTNHAMIQHRNIEEYNPQTTGLASPASTFEQFDRSKNLEANHPAGNNEPMVENMSKLPSQEQVNDPFYNSTTSREIHGITMEISTPFAGTFAFNTADKDFVKEKYSGLPDSISFYMLFPDSITGIGNRRSNNSAESLSVKNDVYLLDLDLITKESKWLAYRMIRDWKYSQQKASTSDVIQQIFVSQLSSALYLLGGYGFDKGDENSTVIHIFALRARRKSVLHRSYWLITEELFTNAIRQTIRVTDLYYTAIYPIDSRVNTYLPGLRGGFFYVKDINHQFFPINTK